MGMARGRHPAARARTARAPRRITPPPLHPADPLAPQPPRRAAWCAPRCRTGRCPACPAAPGGRAARYQKKHQRVREGTQTGVPACNHRHCGSGRDDRKLVKNNAEREEMRGGAAGSGKYPVRDLNSCRRRERAVSWATRRTGLERVSLESWRAASNAAATRLRQGGCGNAAATRLRGLGFSDRRECISSPAPAPPLPPPTQVRPDCVPGAAVFSLRRNPRVAGFARQGGVC